MSIPKNWSDISIQVPQLASTSAATPCKNLKATVDKVNLQAELAKFATAAQLGQFTYTFGTFVNEKCRLALLSCRLN